MKLTPIFWIACLIRWVGFGVIYTIVLISALGTTDAQALTAKNFQGDCAAKYKAWKKQQGFGAAAIANNGNCGFSWNYGTVEEAKRVALSSCRSKSCVVVEEKQGAKLAPTVIGTAETITLKEFQARQKLSKSEMRERFGAVGRINCPWGSATTFLLTSSDIFITSDHLFIAMEKNAPSLGREEKCSVEFFYSKERYKIKKNTLIHGFRISESATQSIGYDWAVGKLNHPVDGVQPYSPATDIIDSGTSVSMLSQGTNDFVPRVCLGNVSAALRYARLIEFTTNCTSGPGTSGGPIIAGRLDSSAGNWHSVVGITRGYTEPYYGVTHKPRHVAIPVDGSEIAKSIDSLLRSSGIDP